MLYNIEVDVNDSKDVTSEHPEIIAELTKVAEEIKPRLGEFMMRGQNNALPALPFLSYQ